MDVFVNHKLLITGKNKPTLILNVKNVSWFLKLSVLLMIFVFFDADKKERRVFWKTVDALIGK